jgi:hypothetical protein
MELRKSRSRRQRAPARRWPRSTASLDEQRFELHRLAQRLTLPSLAQVIRLLESDKVCSLTNDQIRAIGEYGSIEIDGQRFFDQAFCSGKEAAGSLGFALSMGRELVLEDLRRLRAALVGSDGKLEIA